jgi:hypothetical protein
MRQARMLESLLRKALTRVLSSFVLFLLAGASPALAQDKQIPAEEVFKNVQQFKGKPAARVIPAMDALTGLLGVACSYCHVPREWDKDDKPQKRTARRMFEMMGYLNDTHFGGQNRISCWTCHRGHGTPPELPQDPRRMEQAKAMIAIAAGSETKPAETVFHKIEALAGTPAQDLPGIMAYFSQALGVPCAHCHVMGRWDEDTPAKQTARKMLAMVDSTVKKFYGGSGPLGCPDCHQGSVKPQFLP